MLPTGSNCRVTGCDNRPMTGVSKDFVAGLAGVVAFETEIAEPDKDGGALRYRGVDIEDLVDNRVTFICIRLWNLFPMIQCLPRVAAEATAVYDLMTHECLGSSESEPSVLVDVR